MANSPRSLAPLPRNRWFAWQWLAVILTLGVAACEQELTGPEGGDLVVAPAFSSHGSGSAGGGPIFLSGDDADDGGHCRGSRCGQLYGKALSFIIANSGSGGTGILAIGANGSNARAAITEWNSPTHGGPNAVITHATSTAAISSANFNDYAMIYIASDGGNTSGGINFTQMAALNARQADIVDFVNVQGGGLMALTQAGLSNRYGWLPIPLTVTNSNHSTNILPTPEMNSMVTGVSGLSHCCYHSMFTGPDGFSGLEVLAFHDHNGNGVWDGRATEHAMILGGVKVTIQGTISLSPGSALLGTGDDHTVTAVAEDGRPPTPAVGATVTFSVTSGPNAGTTGTGTTDATGSASFTYTGTGGVGVDKIIASFVDSEGNTQTSNTVSAEWELRNQPPVADAGPDQVVEATGPSTDVTLDGSGSFDPDGDPLTYAWSGDVTASGVSPTVGLGLGTYNITLTVDDGNGANDSDDVSVRVEDTTPPDLTFPPLEQCSLWPPNHKMRTVISGISASDLVDGSPAVSIMVTSNEDINGTGDGNTDADWMIVDNGDGTWDVQVRAERDGGADGRIYTITATATDAQGNTSSAFGSCTVPHDQRGKGK